MKRIVLALVLCLFVAAGEPAAQVQARIAGAVIGFFLGFARDVAVNLAADAIGARLESSKGVGYTGGAELPAPPVGEPSNVARRGNSDVPRAEPRDWDDSPLVTFGYRDRVRRLDWAMLLEWRIAAAEPLLVHAMLRMSARTGTVRIIPSDNGSALIVVDQDIQATQLDQRTIQLTGDSPRDPRGLPVTGYSPDIFVMKQVRPAYWTVVQTCDRTNRTLCAPVTVLDAVSRVVGP